jgi:hypothetical protein
MTQVDPGVASKPTLWKRLCVDRTKEAADAESRRVFTLGVQLGCVRSGLGELWDTTELQDVVDEGARGAASWGRHSAEDVFIYKCVAAPVLALSTLTSASFVVWLALALVPDQGTLPLIVAVTSAVVAAIGAITLLIWLSDRLTLVVWVTGLVGAGLAGAAWFLAWSRSLSTAGAALLIASTVAAVVFMLGAALTWVANAVVARRAPVDAWDQLFVRLVGAMASLSSVDFGSDVEPRREFAVRLGDAARGARLCLPPSRFAAYRLRLDGDSRTQTRSQVDQLSRSLTEHQRIVVSPSKRSVDRVAQSLARACVAAARRDIDAFDAPSEAAVREGWWQRNAVKLIAVGAITAAAAFVGLVPDVDSGQLLQARIVLGLSAVLTLVSPADGLKGAATAFWGK